MHSSRHDPRPVSTFKDDAPVSATLDDLLDRITLLALLRDQEIRTVTSERETLAKNPPQKSRSLPIWAGVAVVSFIVGGITAVNKAVEPEPNPLHDPLLSGSSVALMLSFLGMLTSPRSDENALKLRRREKIAHEYDVMIFDLAHRTGNFDGIDMHRFDDTPQTWHKMKRNGFLPEPFTLKELESGKHLTLG